jgi:hypothetical protein
MKSKLKKTSEELKTTREKILLSMMASFKIEGIDIPKEAALDALRRIELSMEK